METIEIKTIKEATIYITEVDRRRLEKLIEIAEGGLERRNFLSSSGKDERVHLTRLKALVANGECPADRLLDGLAHVPDQRAEIIARCDLGAGS